MDVRCLMLKQFKRLYNFYFRISAIIFGKQSKVAAIDHSYVFALLSGIIVVLIHIVKVCRSC